MRLALTIVVTAGLAGVGAVPRAHTAQDELTQLEEEAGRALSAETESSEAVWTMHETHRASSSADDIAWLAVTNGYPGECEGYVPCYANILNWLDGEYLRRHPRGRHADEAVAAVRTSLDQALKLLSEPSLEFLNPATDCGDLKAGLEPLRQAVLESNADGRNDVVAMVDRLLSRCR